MKIVSLLPSATEIIYALGLGDQLAAVTHECDFPEQAAFKPVITSSALDHSTSSSSQIHKGITGRVHEGRSIYKLDEKLLKQLQPDLILTQELCEVCAVSYNVVTEAARVLEGEAEIVSLEPNRLADILSNIALVGEKTNHLSAARGLNASLQHRIDLIATKTAGVMKPPRVFCLEWLDPPFAAGHWVPEMVTLAGGQEILGVAAERSRLADWQAVIAAAPEIIVLMPCGFDIPRTLQEVHLLTGLPFWPELPAVQEGRVFLVNGSAYFNRPGPRVVDGLELLAQIIHPEIFSFDFPQSACQRLPH